jgi:hypothetical protein
MKEKLNYQNERKLNYRNERKLNNQIERKIKAIKMKEKSSYQNMLKL